MVTPDQLRPARLKFEWAHRHVHLLYHAITELEDDNRNASTRLKVDGEWHPTNTLRLEPGERHESVVVGYKTVKPFQVPLILGDVLTNLRACLDYLAWASTHRAWRSVRVQFPIWDENPYSPAKDAAGRDANIQKWQAQTGGLSFRARWLVMSRQPYRGGNGFGEPLLSELRDLVNADKHQALTKVWVEPAKAIAADITCVTDSGIHVLNAIEAGMVTPNLERHWEVACTVHNLANEPVTVTIKTKDHGADKVVMKDALKSAVAVGEKAMDILNAVGVILTAFEDDWEQIRNKAPVTGGGSSRIVDRA